MRCGSPASARAERWNGKGSAAIAAPVSPSRNSARRVISIFHSVVRAIVVLRGGGLIEQEVGAPQHGGEQPAPGALARGAQHEARLAPVGVERPEEVEPAVDPRVVRGALLAGEPTVMRAIAARIAASSVLGL